MARRRSCRISRARADIDDLSAARLLHVRKRREARDEMLVRFVWMMACHSSRGVGLRRLADVDAGVDQDVEPAQASDGLVDHRTAGRFIPHVHLHRDVRMP